MDCTDRSRSVTSSPIKPSRPTCVPVATERFHPGSAIMWPFHETLRICDGIGIAPVGIAAPDSERAFDDAHLGSLGHHHFGDIETNQTSARILRQEFGGQTPQSALLSMIDRRCRSPEETRRPGLDLADHRQMCTSGHDVDLASTPSPIASHDLEPTFDVPVRHQVLAQPTEFPAVGPRR